MLCPHCGKVIKHNCASEIGRRGGKSVSDAKRHACRVNISKAREKAAKQNSVPKNSG
jgi:hypothetical protein